MADVELNGSEYFVPFRGVCKAEVLRGLAERGPGFGRLAKFMKKGVSPIARRLSQ